MFNFENETKNVDSCIIRKDSIPGIGVAIIFSDKEARDAYGRHVIPNFRDTGVFVEQDGVDYDRCVITAELVERPRMVARYWGRH